VGQGLGNGVVVFDDQDAKHTLSFAHEGAADTAA
jgi:hypothetical protein